jgi:glycosyltransferase involved in cell wall biosynthesis
VGTLLDHQGIDTLIDAAPKIKKKCPQCKFLIIGEGPMKMRWQRKALENGVKGDFVFTGQIDYEKVPIWINSMDVCVAPYSKSAGLRSPVKIFDYLACSKPVVASLLPGTTELFEKSNAVCLVPPEDSDQLVHAVIGLLRAPGRADQMGQNGREFIVNHFDRMMNARQVIEAVSSRRLSY